MAPNTRTAAKGNAAIQLTSSADVSPRRAKKRRSGVKEKRNARTKGAIEKKNTTVANKKTTDGGKGRGRKPKSNGRKQAEKQANDEEEQQGDYSSREATNGRESGSSVRATVTKDVQEESMTNAHYDLQHALQFDLVLGFHQDLLIFSRIVHKELMSREEMHKLKSEDVAQWWKDGRLVKELASYEFQLERGEKTDGKVEEDRSVLFSHLQEAKDQRQRFEGTQRQRYEGWYFQIQDGERRPIYDRNHEVIAQDEIIAGRDEGRICYSFVRYEPPVIACEVLQRPVTDSKHVYFKRDARPQRRVYFRKDRKEFETVRHDFAQILIENNAFIPGIRARRIGEYLREKKKTDYNVDTCMQLPLLEW